MRRRLRQPGGVPACARDAFLHPMPVHFAGHANYLRTDPASSHFLLS
ncbi:hypothetical protein ACTMTI_29515 [Nonomuraea sp. H19]